MKLQQNQVWRQGDRFLRIVQLDRMSVDYKLMKNLSTKEGTHHHATKKEFCRLLKGATLLSLAEAQTLEAEALAASEMDEPDDLDLTPEDLALADTFNEEEEESEDDDEPPTAKS